MYLIIIVIKLILSKAKISITKNSFEIVVAKSGFIKLFLN